MSSVIKKPKLHISYEKDTIRIRLAYTTETNYVIDVYEYKGPLPINPKELSITTTKTFPKSSLIYQSSGSTP